MLIPISNPCTCIWSGCENMKSCEHIAAPSAQMNSLLLAFVQLLCRGNYVQRVSWRLPKTRCSSSTLLQWCCALFVQSMSRSCAPWHLVTFGEPKLLPEAFFRQDTRRRAKSGITKGLQQQRETPRCMSVRLCCVLQWSFGALMQSPSSQYS